MGLFHTESCSVWLSSDPAMTAKRAVFESEKAMRILESVCRGAYLETGAKAASLLPQQLDAWIEDVQRSRWRNRGGRLIIPQPKM